MYYNQHADNRQVTQVAGMPQQYQQMPQQNIMPYYMPPRPSIFNWCNRPVPQMPFIPYNNPSNEYSPSNSPMVHQQVVQNHYHYYGQQPPTQGT